MRENLCLKSIWLVVNKSRLAILLIALCAWSFSIGREYRTEVRLDFRVNISAIEPEFKNNAKQLEKIEDLLQQFKSDTTLTLRSINIYGAASPDGDYEFNCRLARARRAVLEKVIKSNYDIADSLITRNDSYMLWDDLRSMVNESSLVHKAQILEILNDPAHKDGSPIRTIAKLQQLESGRAWRQILHSCFPNMRSAGAIFCYDKKEVVAPVVAAVVPAAEDTNKESAATASVVVAEASTTPSTIIAAEEQAPQTSKEEFVNGLHLKTNLLGLGLLIANAAVEVDVCRHLSLSVPVYYSAVNYFVPTIKFRTLATQPELRYWINKRNTGFFAGAHFGIAYFNLAVGGNYRYQDHDGKNPMIGGGISLGYRMPITKNERWNLEFVIGAGGYSLYYDRFYNIENGKYVDTFRKTYWGIDNAAINISYRFNLKKRGQEEKKR